MTQHPQCQVCHSKHTNHVHGSKWRCLDCDESFNTTEIVSVVHKRWRRFFGWMKEHAPPVQAWVSTLQASLASAAIVIGAVWTYNRFINQETEEPNPNIDIETETIHYSDTLRLLSVHVRPVNSGKVTIEVCKDGLILSMKAIPEQTRTGFVDLKTFPDLYHISDLANYSGGYQIEPGIVYDETRAFMVKPGDVYAITAEVDYNDCKNPGDEIDITKIVKIE